MTPPKLTPEDRARAFSWAKNEAEFCERLHLRGVVGKTCPNDDCTTAKVFLAEASERERLEMEKSNLALFISGSAEIKLELRNKIAELEKEVERLKKAWAEDCDKTGEQWNELRTALAESYADFKKVNSRAVDLELKLLQSQAREVKLRDALTKIAILKPASSDLRVLGAPAMAKEALSSTPTPDVGAVVKAAQEFRDYVGDGDNGPPAWCIEHWNALDEALKKFRGQS